MKKRVLAMVMVLCVAGIAYAFAAQDQKADPLKTNSATELQKAVSGKPGSDVTIRKTVPFKSERVDRDAAKLANAVLPKVIYPTMTHHIGYEGKKFAMTVRFNTDMDRTTVIAGGTVVLDFPKAANAPGQITWKNDREFTWVQQSDDRFVVCTYDPDCEFKLTLKDGIRSKEGLKLDGDNDGKQGGVYTLWLIDLG